jgi:hypothetical protein
MKKNVIFVVMLIYIFSLLVGCSEQGDSIFESYFLINKTTDFLKYESYRDSSLLFDTILLPNDTLFLYSYEFVPPADIFDDPTYFRSQWNKIIIKNKNLKVLFYRLEPIYCGDYDFVMSKNQNHFYWTITPAYISEKSCNMSWEDFERDYLGNE